MQNHYLYTLRLILTAVDLLCINAAFILSYYIAGLISYHYLYTDCFKLLVINNLFWIASVNMLQLYHRRSLANSRLLFNLRWQCAGINLILLIVYIGITGRLVYQDILLYFMVLAFHLFCSQLTYWMAEPWLKQKFKFRKPVALIGFTPFNAVPTGFLQINNKAYNLQHFLDQHQCSIIGDNSIDAETACQQIEQAAGKGFTEVYVALTPAIAERVESLMHLAQNQCVRLRLVPDFNQAAILPSEMEISGILETNTYAEPFENMQNRFLKRLFDLVFSFTIVVLILSWLYPFLYLIIKCQSKGPALFKQLRSGRDNADFLCYKFRSMRVNATANQTQASKNDDRITRIGRFMRKTSLDEFPQFFNVLLGNMSIVGPRPHMLSHTAQYRDVIDKYMVRHYVKPGITGWAQVNGCRGETKEVLLMEKRIEHDIWYLKNWSLLLDLKIIYLTVINLLKGDKRAY